MTSFKNPRPRAFRNATSFLGCRTPFFFQMILTSQLLIYGTQTFAWIIYLWIKGATLTITHQPFAFSICPRCLWQVACHLKIGGIGDGDENRDDVPHMIAICYIPVQTRFFLSRPISLMSPIAQAFLGEFKVELETIETYEKPADGVLATVRSDRI